MVGYRGHKNAERESVGECVNVVITGHIMVVN